MNRPRTELKMASGELSLTSNSSQEGSHEFNCYPNDRARKTSTDSIKTFDGMKKQLDEALIELNALRLQQSDTKMQMNHVMKQLELYKEKYEDAINQVAHTAIEGTSLQTKYFDISNEKRRLEQRIQQMEKKARQDKENGAHQTVCTFHEQYNELKKKFDTNRAEMEKQSKETELCKRMCDDLSRDRNSLALEKNELKSQLTAALTQLESAVQEKNMFRDARDKLMQQNELNIKEMSQLMNQRADELRRVTQQRNAAKLELQTILGERNGVLEENQKLSDDLTAAKEELDKQYKNDQSIIYENETLKRLRDELLAEQNCLREQLEEKELMKSHESWHNDPNGNANELEVSKKEIEKLCKNLERVKSELDKAIEETEVAKSRRDWAISEREKIVQERDSVKIQNDELQKERDTAVSDLLQAIRDSEEIKKQKDEAFQEIEHLRKQIESQVNCSRRSIRWSYQPYEMESLPKNDTEVIEIDMSTIGPNDDIGIVLEGGREDSQNRIDGGITVVSVSKDSPAYGKLRTNDSILLVNNIDCASFSKRMVLETIRNGGEQCDVVVKRHRVTRAHMYAVQLNLAGNRNHGLSLESGIFICKVSPNSLASSETEITAGDRILSINNKSMEGVVSGKDAMTLLDDDRVDSLNIIALKRVTNSSNLDTIIRNKPNRLMNTCTQTDERFNFESESTRVSSSSNSKSTSKISEMFNKFRGKIHMHGHSNQKGSTASESDSLCQENDAIAALDSVLNNENTNATGKMKENIFKRSKKAKKETTKEINKSLGTWPRANILNTVTTNVENHTGTIVQHRKKERPALSLFTGPISLGKDDKSSGNKKDNYFGSYMHDSSAMAMNKPGLSLMTNSNRNSNPIPFQSIYQPPGSNRYSVYSTIETDSAQKNMLDLNRKYPHYSHHHHNANRLSLNITPSSETNAHYNTIINRKINSNTLDSKASINHPMSIDYSQMKNSTDSLLNSKSPMSSLDFKPNLTHQQQQDLISLKSQNSIDSFLSPKSPPSLESARPLYPSENQDFYSKRSSKNVSKFPSDSDSLGMESISSPNNSYTSTLPYATNNRAQTMILSSGRVQKSPFTSHIHPQIMRQTSPLTIPITQSLDITGNNNSSDKLEFDFTQPHHSHGVSMDIDQYQRNKAYPIRDRDVIYGHVYGHAYEGGTFPRKKENQRVRIPSNPSVASKGSDMKDSTGSIEHSEHSSPMPPPFKVEVLSHGANNTNSMSEHNPSPGYLRRITIDKSAGPLGITIQCNEGGGIFVSTVTANSIASRAGLRNGDQLLEVCGINMRDANSKIAAKILRQCGNTMTMLAQYCPDKFHTSIEQHITEEDSVSRSGSPTPRNSPRGIHRSIAMSTRPVSMQPHSAPQVIPKRSLNIKKQKFSDSLENQSDCSQVGSPDCLYDEEEPRVLTLHTKKSTNLGISLMGGNAVGIYIHDVQKNSPADLAGMKKGDQILEYNGVDLRRVTAEHAATEISRPYDKVTVLVQHNMTKFNQIKDEAGDSLYIRAGFDRAGELNEGELRFVKDDILYVDTTIFRGKFGQWRAWKLDEYGHRLKCGIIPSQLKVEEELRLLTDTTDGDGTTKRKSARRSFFRRKKHQRSSSRDSKDLSSFSSTQLSWFSDSVMNEDGALTGYQRVERLDYVMCRPVLILGPLADYVAEKLTIDFPQIFERLIPTKMNCTEENMEEGLQNNILIDYRRRGSIYECTLVQAVQDLCEKNRHCLIDVNINAVERLKRMQIYPIVLLLRFKSARQIKEIKDKMSEKAAKEMYEHALRLESDYRQYISAVIPAGVNITHMSTQIKAAVDEEQNKVLWVPITSQ